MTISYKSKITTTTTHGLRSTSLPTASHPSTHRVEKELNDIKTRVLSSSSKLSMEATCYGLLQLSRLYESMQDVINSVSSIQNEKWVEFMMEGLVGFLDICGIVRDILSQTKEQVRDLQCALRRRKADSSVETSIARYNCYNKKVKKNVKQLIASLKHSIVAKSLSDHHHDDEMVIKTVLQVTSSVFESLLKLFVHSEINSQTPKKNRWSMVVSKLTQRKRVACEEHHNEQINDFEGLHVVLMNRCINDGFSSWSYDVYRLQTVEDKIETIEDNLDRVFRSLIRARASLLGIVSNY